MDRRLIRPLVGILAAIAITTTMDANDLSVFSALPLLPLGLLLWYWERFSRREMGLSLGSAEGLRLGAAVSVRGDRCRYCDCPTGRCRRYFRHRLEALLDRARGGKHRWGLHGALDRRRFLQGLALGLARQGGKKSEPELLWTSIAFCAWHVSAVSLETGFDLPLAQIFVYLPNALFLGLVWGMLRLISGSAVVASVSHAVWNALAYGLFAYGTKVGALGVQETSIYGPEVGYVGLALNAAFAAWLWRKVKSQSQAPQPWLLVPESEDTLVEPCPQAHLVSISTSLVSTAWIRATNSSGQVNLRSGAHEIVSYMLVC